MMGTCSRMFFLWLGWNLFTMTTLGLSFLPLTEAFWNNHPLVVRSNPPSFLDIQRGRGPTQQRSLISTPKSSCRNNPIRHGQSPILLFLANSNTMATGNKTTTTAATTTATSEIQQPNKDENSMDGGSGIVTTAVGGETLESPSRALDYFLSTCEFINKEYQSSSDSTRRIQIVSRGTKLPSMEQPIISIKSLVVMVPSSSSSSETMSSDKDRQQQRPIVVIIAEEDHVDLSKLKKIIHPTTTTTATATTVEFATPHQVQQCCGFLPGTVPPLGHSTPLSLRKNIGPLHTYVDQGLVDRTRGTTQPPILLGNGGHAYWQSLVPLETLMELDHVESADIVVNTGDATTTTTTLGMEDAEQQQTTTLSSSLSVELQPKPFFPVAPPPLHVARLVLEQRELSNPLLQTMVTVVGRVGKLRPMGKRLIHCDLLPPTMNNRSSRSKKEKKRNLQEQQGGEENSLFGENGERKKHHPWRYANVDGTMTDMAVQLIVGKTLCQRLGKIQGELALESLKEGQLILLEAKTNVGNRESLGNWVDHQHLDLVMVEYQILEDVGSDNDNNDKGGSKEGSTSSNGRRDKSLSNNNDSSSSPTKQFSLPSLTMKDIFINPATSNTDTLPSVPPQPAILVDDMESIQRFTKDYTKHLQSLTASTTTVETTSNDGETETESSNNRRAHLVGIDCEWKPDPCLSSPREPQPVLVLQVSLHSLQQVYLFDLMTLLRPMLKVDESMNEVEHALSDVLGEMFVSQHMLKCGYQLSSDLRLIAASYPHMPCFQEVHGVLEVSTLVKRALHITKQKKSRAITMSLALLSAHYLGKTLDKEQQISDWSARPLLPDQIEYASLDAAISPVLVEKALESINASIIMGEDDLQPRIERWSDDTSFAKSIRSQRFLCLPTEDSTLIAKLDAKQLVGPSWMVSQEWITGEEPPTFPY